MKNLVLVFLILVTMVTRSFSREESSSIKILSIKRHILYFKCTGDLIGASIEIENERHQSVAIECVEEAKTIVDFFFLSPGTYLVKVKKGEVEVDIEYINT